MKAEGLLSIIVPTRNNATTLPLLLASLRGQSVAPDEVLVVDGSSSDNTGQIAERAGATLVGYPCDGDRRGFARNLGARLARGDFLLFVDSDMELGPAVIQECKNLFSKGFEAIAIPEVNLGRGVLGAVRSWERETVQHSTLLSPARALESRTFKSSGGFSETNLGFEDLELQATLIEKGVRIGKCTEPIYHHEEGLTLGMYLRKRIYYSESAVAYKRNHPALSKTVFSPLERMRLYVSGLKTPRDLFAFSFAIFLRLVESLHMLVDWQDDLRDASQAGT